VYTQRLRLSEFIVDYDRLKSGFVYPNHFLSAMSIAGVDRLLSFPELQIICDTYTVPRGPSLIMTVRFQSSKFRSDMHFWFWLRLTLNLCVLTGLQDIFTRR